MAAYEAAQPNVIWKSFINGGTTLGGLTLLTACLKLVRVGSDEVEHGFTMNLGSTITDRETVMPLLIVILESLRYFWLGGDKFILISLAIMKPFHSG
mmetsp:Transcript_33677/g.39596  ORF Transcript_33677/g.39596 Transcript_33677/m.39596 type:complete len:97 (-) Transcript_33677:636-926(-)